MEKVEQQIVIKPYQNDWQEEYVIEKEKYISLFGGDCIAIEHIGSTSVEGLGAKPIIDMM
ncbi:GrpB family protein, partial [Bacillus mobilis]|uniref:GrpB family protein n=1 Tax=Bacillus mobilis TaxID=2026190 RepID=UPI00366FC7D1